MSQAYQLFDPAQPGPSKEAPKTDWTKCVLSQVKLCNAQQNQSVVMLVLAMGIRPLQKKSPRFQELKDLPMS